MSKGVKFLLWSLGWILLGTIGSLIAAAIWGWQLPPWMMREPPPVVADQPNLETNWLIVWLVVIAAAIAIVMVLVYFVAREPREPPEPTQFDYTRDSFFNLVWRWTYGSGQIQGIACFCRICDRQCQLSEVGRWPFEYAVMCTVHGEQHRFTGEPESLLHDARIEIQRKLRNGEWKQVVTEQVESRQDGS
jgi:MFS family permease